MSQESNLFCWVCGEIMELLQAEFLAKRRPDSGYSSLIVTLGDDATQLKKVFIATPMDEGMERK